MEPSAPRWWSGGGGARLACASFAGSPHGSVPSGLGLSGVNQSRGAYESPLGAAAARSDHPLC